MHKQSERSDSRRKPRFPRLKIAERRRRSGDRLRDFDELPMGRRRVVPLYC